MVHWYIFFLLKYMHLRPVVTKIYGSVSCIPKKCFNSFLQSTVDVGRRSDENSKSSVFAGTMKLLTNGCYSNQMIDHSRHTVTKYFSDVKTHAATNSKLFKKLDLVNISSHELELAREPIKQREPVFVGFFVPQYAKQRKLELNQKFLIKFCDLNNFEELEMDTDWLYNALAEKKLQDCIRLGVRTDWQRLRSNDCLDRFTANAVAVFSRTCCAKHKQHDKREPVPFKKDQMNRDVMSV